MSARNEIIKTLVDFTSFPGGVADEVLQTLTAAGYRLLAPGELDAETVERCIKELNKLPWFEDVVSLVDVEDALRALEAQESEG